MKEKVRIFLNGQELEFTGTPSILYTFNLDNAVNPTAVKNSYTKTVQVEGTPRNNQIFSDIWDLTRTQSDMVENQFNPSKRTPFDLYIDGDLYETGYCKLNDITRTHNTVVYNLTLYGGIGDFLYNLTYSENGEQLRLKDMTYLATGSTTGSPTTELDFQISIHSVHSAWLRLATDGVLGHPMFDVINFAPCYNGYPDALDADKVLINTTGFTAPIRVHTGSTVENATGFPQTITVSGTTYTPKNGYAFGELNGKMNEWEIRDLRSYLQRPVFRMKKLIEACCDPTQNGGYEVVLDDSFFNSGNTYYENAWMTLPLLSDMEYEEETTAPWNTHIGQTTTYNGQWTTTWEIVEDSARGSDVNSFEIVLRPKLMIRTSRITGATPSVLYTSTYVQGDRTDFGAFTYQLVGYDYQNNAVCASDAYVLTSEVYGSYLRPQEPYWWCFSGSSVYTRLGYYEYDGVDGDYTVYKWPEDITLRMPTNGNKIAKILIYGQMVANLENGVSYRGESYVTYGYRRGRLYTSTALTSSNFDSNTYSSSWQKPSGYTGTVSYTNGNAINSGAKVTKQTLLSIDGSPCQYLLGYLKSFGLYLRKDPLQKKVYILTRSNYYNDSTIHNWEERIDHTKAMKITPLTFKHKWYSFNFNQEDKSAVEEKYYNKYGTNYGTQKVNTGYNFDSETEDLLKGIVYNNAADAIEKSAYYTNRIVSGQTNYPTFLYSWLKYSLIKDDETASVDIASTLSFSDVNLSLYGSNYDAFPKTQFRDKAKEPLDGSSVLLFYNGTKTLYDNNGNAIRYMLTDDLSEMFYYNDNACWLFTNDIFNKAGQQIAWEYTGLPSFGRYKLNNSYVENAWDFGKVKELFIPNTYYNENANIYDRYWKTYINDMYDVNTRVCEAYVRLPKDQGDNLLRSFYWFDNSLWRINKISDWNVCAEDTTKVEFVKVQDPLNYTYNVTPIVPTAETFSCNVTMSPAIIPSSGGVVTFTVDANQSWGPDAGADWIEFEPGFFGPGSKPSGVTTYTATADTYTDTGSDYRTFGLLITGAYDERKSFTFTQVSDAGGFMTINPGTLTFPASGGTQTVTITYFGTGYTQNWIIDTEESYNWQSSPDPVLQSSSTDWAIFTTTVTVTANTGDARNTFFQYENNGYSVTVGVYQDGV